MEKLGPLAIRRCWLRRIRLGTGCTQLRPGFDAAGHDGVPAADTSEADRLTAAVMARGSLAGQQSLDLGAA
ncbi:hypothetical protein [Paracoccus mutanolyticus]|uniref:hypothetical protein n=1 Tax=Paracoccus mutanolyticus TaxID=1499308 RepID=UPI0011AE9BBA|nr:hypothetical protein [Paracoccus mutanolyticus]